MAYYDIGVAYNDLGQPNNALKYYIKASNIDPNDVDVWNNMGNMYFALGQLHEAVKCYEKVIIIKKTMIWYIVIWECYTQSGDRQKEL